MAMADPSWPPLTLLTRQGCCLCEGLQERLEALDPAPPLQCVDVDGDGQITAEEQAQWEERYAAADADGDGRVTADEMRQFARQSQHTHAHGAVQAHGDGANVYED